MSAYDQLVERLSRVVLEDGRVVDSNAWKEGNWRPGAVTSVNPLRATVAGIGDTEIHGRNVRLADARVGDVMMFQAVGPVWVAAYEIQVI